MGNPVRVLHVVVNMNRGGAETLIMNLYRHIDRSRVQFDFLTYKEGIFDEEINNLGGRIHRIPYVTEIGHLRFIREMKHFFISHPKYQIIHAHMDKMSGIVLKTAKKAHVPIRIAHSHNTESEGGHLAKLYKWYVGSYVKSSATHLYACSEAAAKWLFGDRSKQAFILKNGIVTDTFSFAPSTRERIRKEWLIEKDTLVVGHVGRFSNQKNHLFLLEVFAELNKQIPNTILVLAGDGPLKSKITEKIKQLNLERQVKLLGIREDVPKLLQAFDLFVFPSLHEGLPVTLIEAQGAGLRCVISDQITTEVDMGVHLMEFLPIKDKQIWINHLANIAKDKSPRKIGKDALSKKGYDIQKTAKQTQSSYLSLGEGVV